MEKYKDIIRPYYHWVRNSISLYSNYLNDLKLYKKYSIVFSNKTMLQKETDLILNYHGLEKGMLFKEMKKGFARQRVLVLHKILKDKEIIKNINRSQIKVGYELMCKYYELHIEYLETINDFYTKEQYFFYKGLLKDSYNQSFEGVYSFTKEEFYKNVEELDFYNFANSRKSIRNFTGEKISKTTIEKVIALANTSPSVCNRQASNVYLVEDKNKIESILKIQGGFTGFTENVSQLLILTNDRQFYYTVGERNQFYVDGGIYLMNLLYSLHFYKIACCPANWGKVKSDEVALNKIVSIKESEKVICIIPIGESVTEFNTTLSLRRPSIENFFTL
ncbi:nitroreductase family protein [Myroides phaeus]|uniref:nitroreductase family protein n=1 Tax=Myroides phaeus TaxID=702745 RepID=UPI002DBB0EC9|nr:nitroreductase family protein [Myroides phaeus]MEC4116373.1 nitroreductase family protein [Myroides phaeus]